MSLYPLLSMRLIELQAEVNSLAHDHELMTADLFRIADALGVKEEWQGGLAVERLLMAIQDLKGEN